MKKTYRLSPIIPLVGFIGFILSEILIGALPLHAWSGYQLFGVGGAAVFCLAAWISLIVTVTDKRVTRRLFLVFTSTHYLSDIEEVSDISETDIYGAQRYTQVRFKNGDKWNLLMLSTKNVKELGDVLKQYASTNKSDNHGA